jgi:hypothetical protein
MSRTVHVHRAKSQLRQAALVIRSFGDAVTNEAVSQLEPVLERYDIYPAREVNWSWTEPIEWPYAEGSPAPPRRATGRQSPRSRFLRHLWFSVFGTSDRNLAVKTRWSRMLVLLISILLLPSRLFAARLASLPILRCFRSSWGRNKPTGASDPV